MDHWAPVVRYPTNGVTGLFTSDLNAISTLPGVFTGSPSGSDCAGHATPGDKWQNAYGEVGIFAMVTAGSKGGLWLRVADSSNYYAAYITPTDAVIEKNVGGVVTSLFSQAITIGAFPGNDRFGAMFRAEVNGDVISIYYKGVFIGSATDSSITAPGYVSMFIRAASSSTNVQMRRFEAGPYNPSYAGQTEQQAGPRQSATRLR